MISIESGSSECTRSLGRAIGRAAADGDVVLLRGELGAGKTTLAQGAAEALGLDEAPSPTFVLIAEQQGRLWLRHVDLYRLAAGDHALELGLDEWLGRDGLAIIEWPDRQTPPFQGDLLEVTLRDAGDERRTLSLAAHGPRGERLLRAALEAHAACD